jgi:Head domain of trimeric autotransporter adhesin/Chaperone of endosialidase
VFYVCFITDQNGVANKNSNIISPCSAEFLKEKNKYMKKIIILLFLLAVQQWLIAQNVGIGTPTPIARLHVADSSVLFSAIGVVNPTPGNPPIQGAGRRMMWYADKAAFRAGYVNTNEWDKVNLGYYSFATGLNTTASGNASTAMGNSTTASGAYSTTMGQNTIAIGTGSTAIGINTIASGGFSIAMGNNTNASGFISTAMGGFTTARGDYSTALGRFTDATGYAATAIGDSSLASGAISFASGFSTTASGNFSTAMGRNTTASGDYSTGMGYFTTASGDYSTGMGYFTDPSGDYSTAMGRQTAASGLNSTTMGFNTAASGNFSTAMGSQTTASGIYSTAMGFNTTASGIYTTAMGRNTTASDDYSTAMGHGTIASGTASTAMGFFTYASGNFSTAMGSYVSTGNHNGSFVIGDNSTTTLMSPSLNNHFSARFNGGYSLYTSAATITSEACFLPLLSNAWVTASDYKLKEKFATTNGEDFLKKISAMKLGSWNYISQSQLKLRHYGPMAQDFYAAFGKDEYGTIGNDTTINSADFAGVSFIAIQALEKRTTLLQKENEEVKESLLHQQELIALLQKEIELLKRK